MIAVFLGHISMNKSNPSMLLFRVCLQIKDRFVFWWVENDITKILIGNCKMSLFKNLQDVISNRCKLHHQYIDLCRVFITFYDLFIRIPYIDLFPIEFVDFLVILFPTEYLSKLFLVFYCRNWNYWQ